MPDPPNNSARILLIVTEPPGESLAGMRQRFAASRVSVLDLSSQGDRPVFVERKLGQSPPDPLAGHDGLPDSWQRLSIGELIDTDALRRGFLAFVDAWPRRPFAGGKGFDELFRRRGGYSVWWTGPGAERHPDVGVFPKLRIVWLADRAIRAAAPQRVLIYTRQADLAWSLASRCRTAGCECEFLPGSALPMVGPWGGRLRWLAASAARWLWFPLFVLVRAVAARILARTPPQTAEERAAPTVVCASPFFDFHAEGGRLVLKQWRDLWRALQGDSPIFVERKLGQSPVRWCYLGRTWGRFQRHRFAVQRCYADWRLLHRVQGATPIAERYAALGAWLRAMPGQFAAFLRYWRLERTATFRGSFVFAGADVSSLYVPVVRRAAGRLAEWAQTVGAISCALRAAGNVKALLLTEEMYPVGMVHIAAARQLGINTIGVQHGTVFPMHMIYTLPAGQIAGAPTPDHFAAYGEYVQEVVSREGAFPAERVWPSGALRMDGLAKDPPQRSAARQRLGLPPPQPIALVATQLYPWFPEAVAAVFRAAKDEPDWLVCVKAHPRDLHLDLYRRLAEAAGATNVRFFAKQFDDLLAACDVLVSSSSTTVLEAILLGRRTVCVNFSGEPDRYPYVAEGGSLVACSASEVRTALERAFAAVTQPELEAQRQRFLQRHAGPAATGRAAETLAEMVLALCRGEQISPLPSWERGRG